MALIASNHSVIINLSAVFRDLSWDAATVRDNLEFNVISANHAEAKAYRKSNIYTLSHTQCDGYLLVYNFDSKEDKQTFEEKACEGGLERDCHIAGAYCTWLKRTVMQIEKEDESLSVEAVQHVDDEEFKLCLSTNEHEFLQGASITNAVSKWCQVSNAYEEYASKNAFWSFVASIMSLVKTKGAHVNYYTPYKWQFKESPITNMAFGQQVLPGIKKVVPQMELEMAGTFDSVPKYFDMFSLKDV